MTKRLDISEQTLISGDRYQDELANIGQDEYPKLQSIEDVIAKGKEDRRWTGVTEGGDADKDRVIEDVATRAYELGRLSIPIAWHPNGSNGNGQHKDQGAT